ncbi:MAG: NUDIX hydrolase [Deltaproteobacteria bacterium]|nr:MAG: NUDIX hydrolase [Deltaproteobacteria bacterium]
MSRRAAQRPQGLEGYDPQRYAKPSVTVDLLIFTVLAGELALLLIRRGVPPFKGSLALPGGFVDVGSTPEDQGEDLEAAARRELGEETGLTSELLDARRVHLEQLHTFGAPGRDPRMRVISVAYLALVPPDLIDHTRPGDDAAEARWRPLGEVMGGVEPLAFDHARIVEVGLARLRDRLDRSDVAACLVPPSFSAAELRAVFEAVQGHPLDAPNFRRHIRRLLGDGVIVPTGQTRTAGPRGGRPAALYRFDPGEGR